MLHDAGKTSVGLALISFATSKAEPDSSYSTAGLPGAAAWLILIIYYPFPGMLLPRSDPCHTVSPRGVKEADFVPPVPDGGWSDLCTDASSALISVPEAQAGLPSPVSHLVRWALTLPLKGRILGVSSP